MSQDTFRLVTGRKVGFVQYLSKSYSEPGSGYFEVTLDYWRNSCQNATYWERGDL